MRPHLSLNVRDVPKSVAFYSKVFGLSPQKQTPDYAKFDLKEPALNFSLLSETGNSPSRVNHLGVEVEVLSQMADWKSRLEGAGIPIRTEEKTECCYARQDKIWFEDPDGNPWEVFIVHEQLPVVGSIKDSGCCVG